MSTQGQQGQQRNPAPIRSTAAAPGAQTPYTAPSPNVQVVNDISAYTDMFKDRPPRITQYTDPADVAAMYPDFEIRNRYWKDHRKYLGGVTSPGGFLGKSAAIFQLAAPTLLWICDWTALKSSNQPVIPNIIPGDANWELLDEDYEAANIIVQADQTTPWYRLSGYYIYAMTNPNAITLSDVRFGRPPWLKDVVDRTMPASKYTSNLSDGVGQLQTTIPGGGPGTPTQGEPIGGLQVPITR